MLTLIVLAICFRNLQESKCVYIIRNPLSIAVSNYHHIKAVDFGYEGTIDDFIAAFTETGPCMYKCNIQYLLNLKQISTHT